jgi:hypothetical protein
MNEESAATKVGPFSNARDGRRQKLRQQQEADRGHTDPFHRELPDFEISYR